MRITFSSWLLLIFLSLVWGSSFILMKKGLIAYPPEQLAYLRIFISFLSLIPLSIYYFRGLTLRHWIIIFLVGLFGSGIPPFLFATAQVHIDSAVAGILNSLTPIFTFIVGILIFGGKFSWLKLSGVVVGFSGGAIIVIGQSDGQLDINNLYPLLIVGATILYSLAVSLVGYKLRDLSHVQIGSLTFTIMGPIAGILLFTTTDFVAILSTHPHGSMSLLYIAILAVVGTAFSSILYFRLVMQTNVLFASTVTYLINPWAICWGWIDGEKIGLWVLLGMVLILGGVYLSGKREKA